MKRLNKFIVSGLFGFAFIFTACGSLTGSEQKASDLELFCETREGRDFFLVSFLFQCMNREEKFHNHYAQTRETCDQLFDVLEKEFDPSVTLRLEAYKKGALQTDGLKQVKRAQRALDDYELVVSGADKSNDSRVAKVRLESSRYIKYARGLFAEYEKFYTDPDRYLSSGGEKDFIKANAFFQEQGEYMGKFVGKYKKKLTGDYY